MKRIHVKKYLIENGEVFNSVNFPSLIHEIIQIKKQTDRLPPLYKSEILISYLKDHALQTEWLRKNKVLTDLVLSGQLLDGTIESLFESCCNNPYFRLGFENYLKQRFASSQS